MKILNENPQIIQINEMFVNVQQGLSNEIEGSIYYGKLRNLLHSEILGFCKEQLELKQDLNMFRMMIGQDMNESEIREYLDGLKLKYNNQDNNIGIDYHIEVTRVDYGVPVFVVIKRNEIFMKKFVFRFKKRKISEGISNLTISGIPLDALKKGRE